MKTFILCGGFGTRLDYEGKLKAKPMIKIGSKPILIYIIENFILQGFDEFVFCLGHKSETITNYFSYRFLFIIGFLSTTICTSIYQNRKCRFFNYSLRSFRSNYFSIYS